MWLRGRLVSRLAPEQTVIFLSAATSTHITAERLSRTEPGGFEYVNGREVPNTASSPTLQPSLASIPASRVGPIGGGAADRGPTERAKEGRGARLHTSGLVHPAGPLSGAPRADNADTAAPATPRQLGGSRAGGGGRGGGRKKKKSEKQRPFRL